MKAALIALGFMAALTMLPAGAAHLGAILPTTTDLAAGGPVPAAESNVFLQAIGRATTEPTWDSAHDDDRFTVEWKCPSTVASGGAGSGPFQSRVCPAYVLDAQDVLSQPVLVVDPSNPQFMAFHALHGGPGIRPPTDTGAPGPASREDRVHQPHTVFQTIDGGHEWADNPYYSPFYDPDAKPDPSGAGPRTWGVDNGLTRDNHGNLYVASLYVHRTSSNANPETVVALWKSGDASRPFSSAHNLVVKRLPSTSTASSLHAGFVPESEQAFALVLERPSTGAPFVRMWHAGTSDNPLRWEPVASAETISGCAALSNPVAIEGQVFLACAPPTPKGAPAGVVGVYRLDPTDAWNLTKVSDVPMTVGTNLLLAAAPQWGQGMMALTSAGVANGRPYLLYTYGILGERWRPTVNFGAQVTATAGNPTAQQGAVPMSARVTAFTYSQKTGAFHLIFAERWDVSNAASSAKEFTKTYAVVNGGGQFLGTASLGYGNPEAQQSAPANVAGTDAAVWFDQKDSITIFGSGAGERIFVLFGDHGFARFGEVLAVDAPPAAIPLAPPTAPIPLPLPGLSPAIVGAGAGALSMSLLFRMIASKKKVAAEAPSL